MKKTLVLIDGPSLEDWCDKARLCIDYKKLLCKLDDYGYLLGVYYFLPMPDESDESEPNGMRRFLDWLSYNGFRTVVGTLKRRPSAGSPLRSCMSIDIVTTAMMFVGQIEQLVLFSGNGDFCVLVEALQQQGVRVTVVAPLSSDSVADRLRRQADTFVDLTTWWDTVARV